jgi:hypothetical protein
VHKVGKLAPLLFGGLPELPAGPAWEEAPARHVPWVEVQKKKRAAAREAARKAARDAGPETPIEAGPAHSRLPWIEQQGLSEVLRLHSIVTADQHRDQLSHPLAHIGDPRRRALLRNDSEAEQAYVHNACAICDTARKLAAERAKLHRRNLRQKALHTRSRMPVVTNLSQFVRNEAAANRPEPRASAAAPARAHESGAPASEAPLSPRSEGSHSTQVDGSQAAGSSGRRASTAKAGGGRSTQTASSQSTGALVILSPRGTKRIMATPRSARGECPPLDTAETYRFRNSTRPVDGWPRFASRTPRRLVAARSSREPERPHTARV